MAQYFLLFLRNNRQPSQMICILILVTPEAKKAIRIASIALGLSFLAGNVTVIGFVTAIFVETGSSLSPANSSILVTAVQIVANLLVLNIVDRIDRRVNRRITRQPPIVFFIPLGLVHGSLRIFVSGGSYNIFDCNTGGICHIRCVLHVLFTYAWYGLVSTTLFGHNHIFRMHGRFTDSVYSIHRNIPRKSK